ncbi:MAG: hypothetical protein JWL83_843 [Actinomycetia bacterium]|nr:hypothetical protein [Actinomycetes bacterium]
MTSTTLTEPSVEAVGRRLPHLPALDGLRGLAVAAVLCFHAQYTWAGGGFLGVSAFFTLSGFLITTLLIVERDAMGHVNLRTFWARRARRLLPAAFLALGGIVLYGAFAADAIQRGNLRADVFSALGYVANWRFIFHHQSYAEIFNGKPSPVLHFWSLAIEEQFYVVFPLLATLLLWLGRGRARLFGIVLGALVVGSVVLSHLLMINNDVQRVYYGTDTRAPELLIGALLAIVLVGRRRPATGAARVALKIVGSTSFLVVLYLWATARESNHWLYEGGFALHALLVAAVLAESLLPGPLSALLSVQPLRWLGRISYGVYLYHWPIYLWLSPARVPSLSRSELFVLRVAVTLAVATASFYLVERPVRLSQTLPRWWPRVVAPIAVCALLIGVVTVPQPAPTAKIVFKPVGGGPPPQLGGAKANAPGAPVGNSSLTAPIASHGGSTAPNARPKGPTYIRPLESDRPIRILVVGDSVGQTLGRGFELWGMHTGRAQVWNDAHYYCSLGRYAPRISGIGMEGPQATVCDSWAERWPKELQQFNPDVTIVLYTIWESVMRKPPGSDTYLNPGDPRYDSWQLSEYNKAADTLSARGGKVVWLTVPCIRPNGPFDAADAKGTDLIRYENAHQIGALRRTRPKSVHIVDLFGELCPGGQFNVAFHNVAQARPDGAHFSDAGAEAVAGWLMDKILKPSSH